MALVGTALLVIAWNVSGQEAASAGSRSSADLLLRGFPDPENWLDRATGGEPAFFLGQRVADPNGVHMLEFWNRSLKEVWGLDETTPGPGPTKSPDLAAEDGKLYPDPGYKWVVADSGLELRRHPRRAARRLAPVEAHPAAPPAGVGDGDLLGRVDERERQLLQPVLDAGRPRGNRGRGRLEEELGRPCASEHDHDQGRPAGDLRQAARDREVTELRRWVVRSGKERVFRIPTPPPPFRVEVTTGGTFVPADLDPRVWDRRPLSAKVTYRFVPRQLRLPRKSSAK